MFFPRALKKMEAWKDQPVWQGSIRIAVHANQLARNAGGHWVAGNVQGVNRGNAGSLARSQDNPPPVLGTQMQLV